MANWYYTKFTLVGGAADIEAAHALLTRLPIDSDGELSLTDMAETLECDPEQTFCAGYVEADTISRGDGRIDFSTWTKWQPPYQIVYALCQRYASLRYYFMAFLEEYCTNDAEGRVYPERVYVELSEGDRIDERGFLTIGEALAWIGESTGRHFASEEQVRQHFDSLDDYDSYCNIHQVRVIDESEQLTFLPHEGSLNLLLLTPDGTRAGEIQVTYPSAESKD
ncbi:MAG: hypothetical protein HDS78_03290 [Bacteroidales bacterium]|nr:hypothetical protein [Bacteroidales bacterium]